MSSSNSLHSELKKVQALCTILEHLKITTFFQLRIFPTGKFLVLSNSLAVYSAFESEQAIGSFFSQLIENSRYGAININLWPSPTTDEFLSRLSERSIYCGISISYALDGYIDIFSFATNRTNGEVLSVYLNNLSLLKRFIVYFRFKSKKILESKTAQSFSLDKELRLSKKLTCANQDGQSRFKNKVISSYINAALSKKLNRTAALTEKETRCLTHLLAGKSIKMMAEELNISRKTVEACLKNIRIKTGFYTKEQLLSIFNRDLLLLETL